MKKKLFSILAICLSICFLFAGCNLVSTNSGKELSRTAITVNGDVITKEDIKSAYNIYIDSYYNQYQEKAFDELIDDLIEQKLVVAKAEELIQSGDIVLTNTEKNYMISETFKAILSNLEKYETTAKTLLKVEEESEESQDTNAQYVYEAYEPYAEVVLNTETNKYEIKLTIKKLIAKTVNDETEYEYVSESKYASYSEPTKVLTLADFEYAKLNSEDATEKAVAKEARRLYLQSLLKNEEGKELSTDEDSVFARELERVYKIIYRNFLTTKLYQYTLKDLDITETEVLNSYLTKVQASHDRYEEDSSLFETELTRSIQQANQFGRYSSPSKSIKDVFYVPNSDEAYFVVFHIIVRFTDEAVERINEAYKAGLESGDMSNYNAVLAEEKSKIRLNERDENGTIARKATDEEALTFDQMVANLNEELSGATTAEEKGDIFNKYLYKYTTDTGLLQIQYDYFGNKINDENWYGYIVGTEYKGSYIDEFVSQARALYNNGTGEIGSVSNVFYMDSWSEVTQKDEDGNALKDEDGKEIKINTMSYGGYDIMMYGGVVANAFESFDDEDFDIDSLPTNALKIMSEKRLGLIGNKTLFDLIYEEIYDEAYSNLINELKDELVKTANIKKDESVYNDLNPFK